MESDEDSDIANKRTKYLISRFHGLDIDPAVRLEIARREYERRESEKNLPDPQGIAGSGTWISLGPDNTPEPYARSVYGAGRVTAIVPHPSISGTLFAASETGGAWKTIDGGNSWFSLTDSIPMLSAESLAIAPSSPNVIYMGTGSHFQTGIGVLKSIDGGQTWILPSSVIAPRIYSISVNPVNPNELEIGTDLGVHRSTDGGVTWAALLKQLRVYELTRNPTNPQIIYAACAEDNFASLRKVYKSVDGGANWIERSSGLPQADGKNYNNYRLKLDISPSSPQILYLTMMVFGGGDQQISHIFKSEDAGDTWVDLPSVYNDPDFGINSFLGQQSHLHIKVTINPTNPNDVYAGGVRFIHSVDGGQSWARSFYECPANCIHSDLMDMAWQGHALYMAGDGGVWKTSDGGLTAFPLNLGLVIRQYYSLFNDPINLNRVYAGSQDNGTDRRSDSGGMKWKYVYGGDGFDTVVNRNNPERAYVTYQLGAIFRTDDASAQYPQWTDVRPHFTTDEWSPFETMLAIDPNNSSILYAASNRRIWKTVDGGNTWSPLPTTTTDGVAWYAGGKPIIAPSNSQVLIVSRGDRVFRSNNGGGTWASSAPPNPPGCSMNFMGKVSIDPTNPQIIFAPSFCNVGGVGGTVFISTDGGATWTQRSNGLPTFFNSAITADMLDSNTIYLGTEVGVYRTTNQGLSWTRLGTGLPAVIISDMQITSDGRKLRIATYGRGVWEYRIRPIVRTSFDFDGDGKSDEAVFRPSNNVWYLNRSQAGFVGYQFGAAGDVLAPADFTGDGKTDVAVFRPSAGAWFILRSEDNTFYSATFGASGDVPVPGDFDGDGKDDTAVFRPSTGYWFLHQSTAGFSAVPFGTNGDVPTLGDFDGDGKTDVSVFRPSNGVWYRLNSSTGSFVGAQFGQAGDKVVPADYTGDGKADLAVWRPADGTWYIQRSEGGSFYALQFGAAGDIPSPGDFDGDGKADPTVFRPSSGIWYEQRSTSGFAALQFGTSGDRPAPNAYVY